MINTICLLLLLPVAGPQVVEDLTVLDGGSTNARRWIDWNDPGLMLVHHLNDLTRACLASREDEIGKLKSAEAWENRQAKVRQTLDQILGPWPARTPLNARVTGILHEDGYHVEKIVFESMPNFHVTGALFIPEGHSGRSPAILDVIGHSTQAFRRDIYQNVILNLVHKGFVVFTIDPLGQGERLQYFDPQKGKSIVGSSTQEHSYAGIQCFLTGRSIARYFTWDGIRAIDFLLTRPEVDPNRIGVTGLSGGGTQSSYIGAIDQRVHAVAPTGFITSISRLLGSIGPQDAEQVFYHGPLLGIDHADLLEVRAPKPTLQVTTTRDFFSIQGARETAAEVRQVFEILGHPEHFDQVEDDYEHGFTKKNNEATYAFFQKFLDLPSNAQEAAYPFLTEQELTVTETGQVSTSLQSETVFRINRQEAEPLLKKLEGSRQELSQHLPRAVLKAEQLSGYRNPDPGMTPVFQGQYQRDGYRVEKWGLAGEGQTVIPTLVFAPDEPSAQVTTWPAIIYAHDKGKSTDAAVGGTIEALVRSGYIVAAPDLLGYGETAYKLTQGHAPVQPFFNALMSGRSVAGINAGDAVRVLEFLQARDDVQPDEIGAVAVGDIAPALLHATAFEPEIRWLILVDSLLDYKSIVMHEIYDVNANSLVAGALTDYDLPDLLASIAPRPVALLHPRTHLRTAATRDQITSSLGFAQRHAQNELRVETQETDLQQLIQWCVQEEFVSPKEDPKLPNVLLIGDSISIAYTLPVREQLSQEANVWRPAANCGPTTRGVASLDAWLGDRHWDVIHFNFGLHDLRWMPVKNSAGNDEKVEEAPQVSLKDYEANLRKIVTRLKKTGATLIWCETTPVPAESANRIEGDEENYNAVAAKVMREIGEIQIDPLHDFAKLKAQQLPANVHYTPEGSEQLAGQVTTSIRSALALRSATSP